MRMESACKVVCYMLISVIQSFTCSALLTLLAHSAVLCSNHSLFHLLAHSFVRSLAPELVDFLQFQPIVGYPMYTYFEIGVGNGEDVLLVPPHVLARLATQRERFMSSTPTRQQRHDCQHQRRHHQHYNGKRGEDEKAQYREVMN